ncbi:MAG TPA: ATP-binding protein, partial [Gemmatimonadaceae bacterium]|nr:ATP-binding protein [Gemmatimonadaceae bacterium]
SVPFSLDEHSFEQIFDQLAALPPDEKILVDARRTRWASPYGLTGLLAVAQTRLERPAFAVPESDETASDWARAAFFRQADTVYDISGKVPRTRASAESSVLLEVTPVGHTADIHTVVENIQQRAHFILQEKLHLESTVTMRFTMALSEVCQNVIEHAGTGGWVAVQAYKWSQRLGRSVVVIAVCDAGMGFRKSMESSQGPRLTDRWDDGMALEETVMRGATRFRDPGRGQGLAGVRKFIGKWAGKFSVRSGTARIAVIPSWDEDVPLKKDLAPFPGAQLQLTIPEKIPDQ